MVISNVLMEVGHPKPHKIVKGGVGRGMCGKPWFVLVRAIWTALTEYEYWFKVIHICGVYWTLQYSIRSSDISFLYRIFKFLVIRNHLYFQVCVVQVQRTFPLWLGFDEWKGTGWPWLGWLDTEFMLPRLCGWWPADPAAVEEDG